MGQIYWEYNIGIHFYSTAVQAAPLAESMSGLTNVLELQISGVTPFKVLIAGEDNTLLILAQCRVDNRVSSHAYFKGLAQVSFPLQPMSEEQ